MLQILHNSRCRKSRDCCAFIDKNGIEFEVINYLENPLNSDQIKALIIKLKIKPLELIRQKEITWIENYKDKTLTNSQIINALIKHPILMQRPIIIDGERAIIGRDLTLIEQFIT